MKRVVGASLLVLAAVPTAAFSAALVSRAPAAARTVKPTACRPLAVAACRAPTPVAVAAGAPEEEAKLLDLGSLGRYLFAVLIQMVLVTTAFGFVDLCSYGPLPGNVELGGPLPWQAVVGIFLAMSVRSRLFNPLDNSRPALGAGITREENEALRATLDDGKYKRKKAVYAECAKRGLAVDNTMDADQLTNQLRFYFDKVEGAGERRERVMPDWTPPGVTFPLMWVGVVAPLRAFAASLVYEASTGRLNEAHLNDPVLLWLVLHLAIGDTWNTVNNVEQRTGAAVPGVALVWLSALFAARQYYDVSPLAGGLLGLTAVWIAVAGALVADTWRINNAIEAEPLFPYKRPGMRSSTRFFFEED